MRVKFYHNLWFGDLAECTNPGMEAVLHCCKNPCHARRHSQKPDRTSKTYLVDEYQEDGREHLCLNMIDAPAPLFDMELFERSVLWVRKQMLAGRKVMIHCNQGESRAPSMALVISSLLLDLVTMDSFPAAAKQFEERTGLDYTPGRGLKIWLEEHWYDLVRRVVMARKMWEKQPERAPEPPPMPEQLAKEFEVPRSKEEVRAFVKHSVLFHFAGFTEIEDKANRWITPTPNKLQLDMAETYEYCIETGIPCRMIVLKPRQVGCSTFTAQLCYHHMRRFAHNMMIMGDVTKRTEAVYRLFNRISEHDKFDWDSTYQYDTRKGRFLHADNQVTKVMYGTANDPKAGISETRQVVWMTEAARYQKSGVRTDTNVITALLNSLANEPNSLAIAESTADGASGWLYQNYKGAVTLEERKAGKIGNGWIKVFAAWFEFPEHSLPHTPENEDWFNPELNEHERYGAAKYGWTPNQIAWRRRQVKQACNNDPRMFNQDFPHDAESCFLASGRPRFTQDGLTRLEKMAESMHSLGRRGVLERKDTGKIVFRDAPEGEAWLWICEDPTPGMEYLGAIDPCTGAQSEGAAYPDAHAAGILRKGYMDDDDVWHNDLIAAVIDVENGCRWDDTLVVERFKLVIDYYGDCMVVPETGNGLGVLNCLQREGARIYRRRKHDAMNPGKIIDVAGWETNTDTRNLWVGAASDYIRNEAVDITYLPMVRELQTFYINDRGKAEAKQGCHDDFVTLLGLLLYCREYADRLPPPRSVFFGEDTGSSAPRQPAGAFS